jgi:hypothetical protein
LARDITSVLALAPAGQSVRPDSIRRPQATSAFASAGLSHAVVIPASSPCGNRTHLSALKGRYRWPMEERAIQRVGRGALESPSAGLQPAASPSQLPTRFAIPTKRPGVFVTPGQRLRARDVHVRTSRPQGIEPERGRRRVGKSLRSSALQDGTRTPGDHGRPRCRGGSGRFDTGPASRPARLAPLQTPGPGKMFARFREDCPPRSRGLPSTRPHWVEIKWILGSSCRRARRSRSGSRVPTSRAAAASGRTRRAARPASPA